MSALSFPQNVLAPVLVGRAAPLEFLTRALDDARAGRGKTILLAGEAGIGKTRLAAETQTLAAARGFEIFSADCFETERASPFAPLSELLRAFAATRDDAALTRAFHHTPQLLHLTPEFASRVDVFNGNFASVDDFFAPN